MEAFFVYSGESGGWRATRCTKSLTKSGHYPALILLETEASSQGIFPRSNST